MKNKSSHATLFSDLEKWGHKKDAYSLNDFLKEKGIPLAEFEQIANSSKKFIKIWDAAEDRAWENVLDALFTKILPRDKIAEYIKESEVFQDRDPEEVMRSLESGQAKFELYLTAIGDTESLKKHGRIGLKINDVDALMLCGLQLGAFSESSYMEYLAIKAEYPDEEDEASEDDGSYLPIA